MIFDNQTDKATILAIQFSFCYYFVLLEKQKKETTTHILKG